MLPSRVSLVSLGFFVISLSTPYQTLSAQEAVNPRASSVQSVGQPRPEDDVLLKYATFLHDESKEHREFLEFYYRMTAAGLTAVIALLGGLVAWLNWRTKDDIGRQVESLFREHAESVVQSRVKQFDDYVSTTRTDVDRLISETRSQLDSRLQGINGVLLDLSAQATIPQRPDATSDGARLAGRRILWVDDVPENNDYPREILTTAGATFDLARSTEEALGKLASAKYDLVISDMGRGRNYTAGLDLLQAMKSKSDRTPVIIFANPRGVSEHGPSARALGAIDAIYGTTRLLQSVQRVLTSTTPNGVSS
jgi:CheY-like chemotaxis protein